MLYLNLTGNLTIECIMLSFLRFSLLTVATKKATPHLTQAWTCTPGFFQEKKTFLGRYSSSFNQKLWHLSRPIISVPNRRYTQGRSVLLVLKTYRCNYFARHQYSLVNIYSYRNQEHLHSGLEHDRNMTPTDIRPHLDKKVIICRNKPEKFNVC